MTNPKKKSHLSTTRPQPPASTDEESECPNRWNWFHFRSGTDNQRSIHQPTGQQKPKMLALFLSLAVLLRMELYGNFHGASSSSSSLASVVSPDAARDSENLFLNIEKHSKEEQNWK